MIALTCFVKQLTIIETVEQIFIAVGATHHEQK
jgi:hypothetical protein